MIGLKQLVLLKHGAPPRNVLEAALRAKWGGGGTSYEKTVGPAPIISISDAKPKPAKSLIVGMEPIQAGSGDPSPDNIRPITGRTGVTVERTGKNLLAMPFADYRTTASKDNCFYLKSGTYTFSFGSTSETSWRFILRLFNTDGNEITSGTPAGPVMPYRESVHGFSNGVNTTDKSFKFTLESDAYVRVLFWSGSTTASSVFTNAQIEFGSTASDYSAYSGASYPVTWQTEAGTVYGGTVDLVSGVLTVDRAQIASYNGEALPGKWISDRDVYAEGTSPTTGAQVVYELAEPQTYQLTPQQIQLLKGSNVLWSDANALTLTYLGTTPANLFGGMLGGGYTPPEEEPEEEEQVPEEEQAEESDPEEVIPDGES